ncbi:hypothetical protein Tco_0978767 [Tanacetum coccineum]|uniref:Uncharacterized protein n=1 Tax=Tanacetum coccineum TaxID=301880 RepID=A0ABQ5EP03_9ASTR
MSSSVVCLQCVRLQAEEIKLDQGRFQQRLFSKHEVPTKARILIVVAMDDGSSVAVAMDEGHGVDKGLSVNEYLVRPEDEGKALSDQNHHTSSLSPLNTHQANIRKKMTKKESVALMKAGREDTRKYNIKSRCRKFTMLKGTQPLIPSLHRNTMPKSIHLDHHDTAHYIPMYHRTGGFTGHEREVYKSLVSRLIHEGRVIDSTFLDDQSNLRPTFTAIGLTGNKDHPNACLCYMLYCLTIGKPFNLAYYIAHRMVSVTKSADMTLPYGMLLTRLFEHVRVNHWYSFSNELYLVDHMMMPLSNKRVFQFKHEGKRHRLPTPTPSNFESSDSPSPTPHQGMENDPVNNFTLDPIPYMNQLPPIEGGESP